MPGQEGQRGLAAIEFALAATLLLALLFGIVSYAALFWAQQKVTQLAGEGARYAVAAGVRAAADPAGAGCGHVQQLWQQDALLQSAAGGAGQNVCADMAASCTQAAGTPGSSCLVTFTVSCSVAGWPLLNAMRVLGGVFSSSPGPLLPAALTASATVRVPNMDPPAG